MTSAAARLLLASSSPQRRAILNQLGLPFRVAEPAYVERPLALAPRELAEEHSRGKAGSVVGEDGEVVLGVDTVVVLSGRVLGKPADQAEACEMLTALQGREHVVCSGLTVVTAEGPSTASAETRVRFRALGPAEIAAYVALGEWRGRAGGYAIQERGALLVESIEGDYLNVVGLPVALLVRMLESTRLGLHFAQIGNSDRLL